MNRRCPFFVVFFVWLIAPLAAAPHLPGVGPALQEMIGKNEIAGAVTVVVTRDQILHAETTGHADIASGRPMTADTLFWIASMTKPITGAAIVMLQDEGKLSVSDAVAKYLPEFADLKTPSGKPANLTLTQILTHTSGLGEATGPAAQSARTLADLVPVWLAARMQFEPGERWKYCQSGINLAGRIVEIVSGMSFDAFLRQRLFDPLGMKDTTFYPTEAQRARLVTAYAKNKESGQLAAVPPRADFGTRDRPPQGNGGLFSTAPDYARFCQMLLGQGTFAGKRILSANAVKVLSSVHTGDLPTGFFQNDTFGQRGRNYGWGIGTCVLRQPHEGVAAMLSPGSFGHGGAWGTQAWIDPVKGVAYVLMVQRSNFPNSDASDVRRAFQQAAAAAALAPPAPVTLRVMSYNIHHAEGLDGKLDIERIARVISDARPDLVGLQEVDRGVARTQGRDLPAELARLTGLTVHFEKNIAHQGGEYGNAVLTRFPIVRARNTHLKPFAQGEQRGVQQVVVDVRGREVLFLNTHLDSRRDPAEREHSATELQKIVAAAGAMPVILVGDFNAVPDAPSIARIRTFLGDAWTSVRRDPGATSPVRKPTRRIDYIWITPAAFIPRKMDVLHSEASDHLPILAELRLR